MGLTPISRSARGRPTPLRVDAGADRLGSGPPSTAPGGPRLGLSSCSLTHRLTSLRSSTARSRPRGAPAGALELSPAPPPPPPPFVHSLLASPGGGDSRLEREAFPPIPRVH